MVLTCGTLLPMPIGLLPHNSDEATDAIGTGNKNQISNRNCFMHGLSSIIIREASLSKLMISPWRREDSTVDREDSSFGSSISKLSLGFTRDEDGIKGKVN
ncbi:hypothetical protein Fot_42110 [Forsythia ovata]|uniref:Uncharacterized protein n=1 Tax=Forsythia ovata TaxID=205694 RepID=A0ABD1RK96_9LAMI